MFILSFNKWKIYFTENFNTENDKFYEEAKVKKGQFCNEMLWVLIYNCCGIKVKFVK